MQKGLTTPVQKKMCATCPFGHGPNAKREFQALLMHRSFGTGGEKPCSPICHSTGLAGEKLAGADRDTPERLCRGARNVMLQWFAAIRFIDAPTDEAWDRKRKELGV